MYNLVLATALLSGAAAQTLETFDGSRTWSETNDPVSSGVAPVRHRRGPHRSPLTARRPQVMGGLSQATFKISGGTGVFNGTCKIVPSLQAPGFCSAQSEKTHLRASYPDISKAKSAGARAPKSKKQKEKGRTGENLTTLNERS